ncbi:MAG: MFS transporter, partial [Alphaproteobacteria bacterium]|nr:MFS transporter [Alphaproteobacteria bacterium]
IALSRFTGTMAITGSALTGIAWLYVALMPAGVLLAIALVPSGDAPTHRLATLRELWVSLRTNRPLWCYCGIIGAWGLGQGAYLSVALIFISDYMHMAAAFPLMMITFFITQALTMPPWYRAVAKFGKHRVWAFSMLVDVLTRPLILLVPFLGGLPALLGFTALGAMLNAPAYICPYSVLGDVVDYDLMRTRVNKAGNIFAFNTLLIKVSMAVGAGSAFAALDFFHYHVGGHNTPTAQLGLLLCYLVYPALIYFAAVAFAWSFPITARRHRAILARISRSADSANPA